MDYQFKTASFIVRGVRNGAPMDEVDQLINKQVENGWEFVQLSSGATATAVVVIVVFRKPKSEIDVAEEASETLPSAKDIDLAMELVTNEVPSS